MEVTTVATALIMIMLVLSAALDDGATIFMALLQFFEERQGSTDRSGSPRSSNVETALSAALVCRICAAEVCRQVSLTML
jgi:hypothetical protein